MCWRVLLKRVVDSIRVIIGNVIPHPTAPMSLVDDDRVIEKLPSATSNPPFRDSILPRACRADPRGIHATGCQQIGYLLAEHSVAIQNHIAALTRFRKCLPELLHDPRAGQVFRDIEMEDPASTVFDDEDTVQDSERDRRHCEKVHARNHLSVIAQESGPEFAAVLAGKHAPEIARDASFGDVEARLQKLPVKPWSAPAWIFLCHLPDESSNLRINHRPVTPPWQ